MDPDSSLAAIALILSLIPYLLLHIVEGYLIDRTQGLNRKEEDNPYGRVPPLMRENQGRFLAKVVLIAASSISTVALVAAFTAQWWAIAVGGLGLVAVLASFQGIGASVGARWGASARLAAPLLWPLALAAFPFSWLQGIAIWGSQVCRGDSRVAAESAYGQTAGSEGEIEDNPEEEDLAPHERRMIRSILKLDETTAREVMVPRMDILASEATASLAEVAELMWDSGHSRVPIYEETIDSIVGIVHSRDLLRHLPTVEQGPDVTSIARTPLFIPNSMRLDDLLKDFQEKHIQVAIVVDEYGGTAGLVTIEDLLEEIVGEIEDEFDIPESLKEIVSDNEAVVDARISLGEVNELFFVNLHGEGFDTLGGLLYQQLGRIPSPGDDIEVGGLHLKVLSTLGRRIKKVQVARATPSEHR